MSSRPIVNSKLQRPQVKRQAMWAEKSMNINNKDSVDKQLVPCAAFSVFLIDRIGETIYGQWFCWICEMTKNFSLESQQKRLFCFNLSASTTVHDVIQMQFYPYNYCIIIF